MININTKDSIKSAVISIISDALRIDKNKINEASRIFLDLNAESLDILDIRFSIEQQLGLKIGEHEIYSSIGDGLSSKDFMEKFTVESLINFVENKLIMNGNAL